MRGIAASYRSDLLRPFAGLLRERRVLELTDVDDWSAAIGEAAALLPEEGVLVIAMDNPLGMAGVGDAALASAVLRDGAFSSASVGTGAVIGKKRLERLLVDAGFYFFTFYYPFPDHRTPVVLLTERGLSRRDFRAENLIGPLLTNRQLPALLDNSLAGHLAPSFLVLAGKRQALNAEERALAFSFQATRQPPFNKMNIFYDSPEGIRVRRRPYQRNCFPAARLPLRQVLRDEAYVPGGLYWMVLSDLLSKPGWTLDELRDWASPYVRFLRDRASLTAGVEWMEGVYVDLTPFNLLIHEGRMVAIDLEWVVREMIPLRYVLFRGLYQSFVRLGPIAAPAVGVPLHAFGLCLSALEGFLPDKVGIVEDFLRREEEYFGMVVMGEPRPVDFELPVVLNDAAGSGEGLPGEGPLRLYPLLHLDLQVFVETGDRPFSEEGSVRQSIGLTRESGIYRIGLDLPADARRLRIDPAEQPGLLSIYSVKLLDGEEALFEWAPGLGAAAFEGMIIVQGGGDPALAVEVLLDHDPMIIFSLPEEIRERSGPMVMELGLSALTESQSADVLAVLQKLNQSR